MDLMLKIPLAAILSIAVLFFLSKLIGNRQISEMSLFDYINSITIGSIAAELASSDNFRDIIRYLSAMVIYGIFTLAFAVISNKSKKVRSFLESEPITLMENGEFIKSAFVKSHVDLNEFLMYCRIDGFFDVSDIDTAILEANGKISIIPKSSKEPVTMEAAGITKEQQHTVKNVIMDGRIISSALTALGKDNDYLENKLNERKIKCRRVFLATLDDNDNLNIYEA